MNNNIIVAIIAVIIVVIGFFIYGAMTDDSDMNTNGVTATTTTSTSAEIEEQREREAAFQAEREEQEAAAEAEAAEVAFTIEVASLPEAQQTSLRTMGMNETSIEITNGMLDCARVDMSETRVTEIANGAVVTASEGVRLFSCYNTN